LGRVIPVEDVVIVSDVRKERDIGSLALSIQTTGLVQPISLRPREDGKWELCGGRSRFLAMRDVLGYTHLEEGTHFVIAPEGADALTIQLVENVYRKDLTLDELAELVEQIHQKYVKEKGSALPGPGSGGWRVEDTAKLLGFTKGYVSTLLSYRKLPPDVRKRCRTVDDVRREVAKTKKRKVLQKLVEVAAKRPTSKDLSRWLSNFHLGDARELIQRVEDGSVDLIFADPPYGISLHTLTDGSEAYSAYEDDPRAWEDLMLPLIPQFYRVAALDSFIIIWCAFERFPWLRQHLEACGFTTSPTPIVWGKGDRATTSNPEKLLSSAVEIAVYGWKGNPSLQKLGETNLFLYAPPPQRDRIHVAQRPDALSAHIISIFCPPEGRVLDPFVGSGSTIRACIELGVDFVGFEKEEEFYNSAIELTKEVCG